MAVYSHLPKWLQGRTVSGEFRPFSHEERQQRIRKFKSGVKLLRRFSHGFRAGDGYDLREPLKIHPSRMAKALRRMATLREEIATPHKIVRTPKKKDSVTALRRHTKAKISPATKLVPVQVQETEHTKVRVRKGSVRVEREFADGTKLREQFFYVPRKVRYFDQIADWFEKNMNQWPDGFYSIVTKAHGQVFGNVERDMWPDLLRSYWVNYDVRDTDRNYMPSFASTIIGFRFVATTLKGAHKEATKRKTMVDIARETARKRRLEEKRKVKRRLR